MTDPTGSRKKKATPIRLSVVPCEQAVDRFVPDAPSHLLTAITPRSSPRKKLVHKNGIRSRAWETNVSAGLGIEQLISKAKPGDVIYAEPGLNHSFLVIRNVKGVRFTTGEGSWSIDGIELIGCEDVVFANATIGPKPRQLCDSAVVDSAKIVSLVDTVAVFEHCATASGDDLLDPMKVGLMEVAGISDGDSDVDKVPGKVGSCCFSIIELNGSSMKWRGEMGASKHPCNLRLTGFKPSKVQLEFSNFVGAVRASGDSILSGSNSSVHFLDIEGVSGDDGSLCIEAQSEATFEDCNLIFSGGGARVSGGGLLQLKGGALSAVGAQLDDFCIVLSEGSRIESMGCAWSSEVDSRAGSMLVVGKDSSASVQNGSFMANQMFARIYEGGQARFEAVNILKANRWSALWSVSGSGKLHVASMRLKGFAIESLNGGVSLFEKCDFLGPGPSRDGQEQAHLVAKLSGGSSRWLNCSLSKVTGGPAIEATSGALVTFEGGRCGMVASFAFLSKSSLVLDQLKIDQDMSSRIPLISAVEAQISISGGYLRSSGLSDSDMFLQLSDLSTIGVDWSRAGPCPVYMRSGVWRSKEDIPGKERRRMGFLSGGATSSLPETLTRSFGISKPISVGFRGDSSFQDALRDARSGDVLVLDPAYCCEHVEVKWRHGIKIMGSAVSGMERFKIKSLWVVGSSDIEIMHADIGGASAANSKDVRVQGSFLQLSDCAIAPADQGEVCVFAVEASSLILSTCQLGLKGRVARLELIKESKIASNGSSWIGHAILDGASALNWMGGSVTATMDKKLVWKASGASCAVFEGVDFQVEDDYLKVEGEGTYLGFINSKVTMSLADGKVANAPFWIVDKARLSSAATSWTTSGLSKSSMIFGDREALVEMDGGSVHHEGPVLQMKNRSKGTIHLDSIEREGSSQFAFLSKHGSSIVISKMDMSIGSQGYAGQGGEIEFVDCVIQPAKTGLMCVVRAEESGAARWTRCSFKSVHEPICHAIDGVGIFDGCSGEGVSQWMTSSGEKGSSLQALNCSMAQTRGVKHPLIGIKKGVLILKSSSIKTGGASEADIVGEAADIESSQCDYSRAGQPVFSLTKGSLKSTADRFEKSSGRIVVLLDGATSNLPQGLDEKALCDVESRLAELPGMAIFKQFLSGVISQARVAMARKKPLDFPLKVIFEGPSGSGKATAAELMGRAAHACGAIASGNLQIIDDVVLDDLTQRGSRGKPLLLRRPMTHRILDGQAARSMAVDGVATLVMISASVEEISEFDGKFPAVAAAFKTRIRFEACTDGDLLAMFENQCHAEGFVLGEGAALKARSYMKKLAGAAKGGAKNGWAFKMAWGMAKEAHAKRVAATRGGRPWDQIPELDTILVEDIPDHGEGVSPKNVDTLMRELDELTGLAEVKNVIAKFVALTQANKRRGVEGSAGNLHLVFSGNPGTGKTTVARLMGDLYRELGLLPSGHVIETDRSGLVGEYIGHTAARTKALAEKAMGGVLFIDEAYALTRDTSSGRDFGAEAVDTLIKIMEDKRRDFAVVMAGYPDLMDAFMDSNPGLKSRVGKVVRFDDYGLAELVEMLGVMCLKEGFTMGVGVESAARAWISARKSIGGRAIGFFNSKEAPWGGERRAQASDGKLLASKQIPSNFGNAREIRKLFDLMLEAQAQRLAEDLLADPWAFVSSDVPSDDRDDDIR